jgi:hypothetical protein
VGKYSDRKERGVLDNEDDSTKSLDLFQSDISTNNNNDIHSVLKALALVDIVALLNWTYVSTIGK